MKDDYNYQEQDHYETCPACKGEAYNDAGDRCNVCKGKGKVRSKD